MGWNDQVGRYTAWRGYSDGDLAGDGDWVGVISGIAHAGLEDALLVHQHRFYPSPSFPSQIQCPEALENWFPTFISSFFFF